MLILRERPLGVVLVEPLGVVGNAEVATTASEETPLLITDNLPYSPLPALHFTAPSLPSRNHKALEFQPSTQIRTLSAITIRRLVQT